MNAMSQGKNHENNTVESLSVVAMRAAHVASSWLVLAMSFLIGFFCLQAAMAFWAEPSDAVIVPIENWVGADAGRKVDQARLYDKINSIPPVAADNQGILWTTISRDDVRGSYPALERNLDVCVQRGFCVEPAGGYSKLSLIARMPIWTMIGRPTVLPGTKAAAVAVGARASYVPWGNEGEAGSFGCLLFSILCGAMAIYSIGLPLLREKGGVLSMRQARAART